MPEQIPARSGLLSSHDVLLRLIISLVIEQLLPMTVGIADVVMATTSGEAAISGVSLVDNINTLVIQAFSALSTGGAVVASQYLGRRDIDNTRVAPKQFLYAIYALSPLLMGAALIFRQHILALIFGRVRADVMENALVYFLLTATAYPFMDTYNAGVVLFRTMGNSEVSMFCSLVVSVINITVNAVLIFGFGMGAVGTGIGTLVSCIAAAVVIMTLSNHPDHVLQVKGLLHFESRGAVVKRILFIGIPNSMEDGIFQAGRLMVLNLITTPGASAVIASAIVNSVARVINVPGMALRLAIITATDWCMRAGETGQAVHYTKRLVGANYLCMSVMSAALFFSAGELVILFHLNPEAYAMAAQVLRTCAVGNVLFWPLIFTPPNSLRAAGDAIFTVTISLGPMFVCRVVLSYAFACTQGLNLGLLGVWLAMIASWAVWAAFFLFHYRRGRWRRIRVI